jgi:cell division protein FtsZ
MSLSEISDAVSIVQNEAHDEANIIFGAVINEEMGDAVNVTVIATGFGRTEAFGHVRTETTLPSRPVVVSLEEKCKPDRPAARTVIPQEPADSRIPAFIRRSQREKNSRHLGLAEDLVVEAEEDLDIPTFLRKQAE